MNVKTGRRHRYTHVYLPQWLSQPLPTGTTISGEMLICESFIACFLLTGPRQHRA